LIAGARASGCFVPAVRGGPTRRAPLLLNALEGAPEFLDQSRERQIEGGAPADQHIVTPCLEPIRVGKPHDFAQTSSHPVALDRIAHLARHRKPDPWRPCVGALACLQNEALDRGSGPRRDAEEIRPFSQALHGRRGGRPAQALNRLRPRVRRALSTLRPPVVDMRLRKP
jgi:hypothetical protein